MRSLPVGVSPPGNPSSYGSSSLSEKKAPGIDDIWAEAERRPQLVGETGHGLPSCATSRRFPPTRLGYRAHTSRAHPLRMDSDSSDERFHDDSNAAGGGSSSFMFSSTSSSGALPDQPGAYEGRYNSQLSHTAACMGFIGLEMAFGHVGAGPRSISRWANGNEGARPSSLPEPRCFIQSFRKFSAPRAATSAFPPRISSGAFT